MRALVSASVLALVLTACGGDDGAETSSEGGGNGEEAPVLYDNSEIIEHMQFEDTGGGYAETTLDDGEVCEALILTGTSSIDLYADAGDTVATNPDRTVGAKIISASEKSCYELVTDRLADFPPS